MKLGKLLIIIIILCVISCASDQAKKSGNAKEKDNSGIILATQGDDFFVGINNGDIHIVFKCKSKEPKWKEVNNTYLFLLDEDTMIQILTFTYDINSIPESETEIDILKSNMYEEAEYQRKYSKSELKLSNEIVRLKKQKALFWSLTGTGENSGTNYYLTLMKKRNHLIGINSVKIKKNKSHYKKLLMNIANTVVFFDYPVTKEVMAEHFNLQ